MARSRPHSSWIFGGISARISALALLIVAGAGCSLRSTGDLSRGVSAARADDAAPPAIPAPDAAVEPDVARPPGETAPDVRPGTGGAPGADATPPPDAYAPPPPGERADTNAPPVADMAPPIPEVARDAGRDSRRRGQAFLVVGQIPLQANNAAVRARLIALGFEVIIASDDELEDLDVSQAALIFISATIHRDQVGTTFRRVDRPVIVSEALLFEAMGLVDPEIVDPGGLEEEQTSADVKAGTPLSAGLSGRVALSDRETTYGWGVPVSSAVRGASLVDDPDRLVVFGYSAGVPMAGLRAPARRVGLFLWLQTATTLTRQGWAIFDAAVNWATAD